MKFLFVSVITFIVLFYNNCFANAVYRSSYVVPLIGVRVVEVCIDGHVWLVTPHGISQFFSNRSDGTLYAFECEEATDDTKSNDE